MSAPKVTVLMPVLNAEVFLKETLNSIWKQTMTDFELLAVDDGSTDRTPELLAACQDSRLRVLRNETRLKLSDALNRGLDEARGEYIARMDADDRMHPDRLASQVKFMDDHPAVACCGSWVRSFGSAPEKILQFPSGADELKAFSIFYTPFAHPTVLFRRKWFVRESLRYDGSFYPTEDYELWSRVLQKFPCDNLSQVLIDYRIHDNSMTGGEWSDMDAQTCRVQQALLIQMGMEPSEEELRIHRGASMGTLSASPDSFAQTEAWLIKLAAANKQCHIYSDEALEDILHYVWFRMTMSTVRTLKGATWKLYSSSPLASYGKQAWKRRGTVRIASIKARLMGGLR